MPDERPRRRLSLRWKLLLAFTAAFTVVFAFIAVSVVHYASSAALTRLNAQLIEATEGAARVLPQAAVNTLAGATNEMTQEKAHKRVMNHLDPIESSLPGVRAYLVLHGQDGTLDYLVAPDAGLRDPVLRSTPQSTVDAMQRAFTATVLQGRNDDEYGQWVSAYSPVFGNQGNAQAIVGMDFPLDYVEDVRRDARRTVLPILGLTYATLIALVALVSTVLVRPIERFTAASHRIADGDYDVDLAALDRRRYADEMTDLADTFTSMASKVADRERSLTQQLQRLQVQIDTSKREQSVREITQTDFFADLQGKAAQMRARMREDG